MPGIGTGSSLVLSGVETAGFLEASALFAQSVAEVHGIVVDDPDRARALVMTMVLGTAGTDLVKQLANQAAATGTGTRALWGEMITKTLPRTAMGPIADRIRATFLKRFTVAQGTNVVGRLIPFGIGAVIGGGGNRLLGRQIVTSSREGFGAAPAAFPSWLEDFQRTPREPRPPREPREPARATGAAHPDAVAAQAPTEGSPDELADRPTGRLAFGPHHFDLRDVRAEVLAIVGVEALCAPHDGRCEVDGVRGMEAVLRGEDGRRIGDLGVHRLEIETHQKPRYRFLLPRVSSRSGLLSVSGRRSSEPMASRCGLDQCRIRGAIGTSFAA